MAVYRRHQIAAKLNSAGMGGGLGPKDREEFLRVMDDPRLFSMAFTGRHFLDHQVEIDRSVEKYRKTAVRSGNAVGKTFSSAMIAIRFLIRNQPSIVVTTAPTWVQVATIFWREMRELISIASSTTLELSSGTRIRGFGANEPQNTSWTFPQSDKWYAIGLSTKKKERFSGRHSDRVLVIIDEASGVDDEIFEAVNAIITGPNDRVLAIGNPTQNSGRFWEVFNLSKGDSWNKIHLNSSEMPWIKNGTAPPAPGLVSKEWIEEMLEEHGDVNSPAFQIHVCGNFSSLATNLLLTLDQARAATELTDRKTGKPIVLACDPAKYGNAETVLTWVSGDVQIAQKTYRMMDEMEVAGLLIKEFRETETDVIVIDADGLGGGIYSRVAEQNFPVLDYHGGTTPSDPTRFYNLRSECYYNLCREIRQRKFCIMYDEKLMYQLAYLPYKMRSQGQIQLISKEELRREGRKSPDRADALMMARWAQWQLVHSDLGVNEEVFCIPRGTRLDDD